MEERYNVYFAGQVMAGFDARVVRDKLAKIFNADQATLDANAVQTLSPQQYVLASERWVEAGATWIGGCCDTRPEYIAALAQRWH